MGIFLGKQFIKTLINGVSFQDERVLIIKQQAISRLQAQDVVVAHPDFDRFPAGQDLLQIFLFDHLHFGFGIDIREKYSFKGPYPGTIPYFSIASALNT